MEEEKTNYQQKDQPSNSVLQQQTQQNPQKQSLQTQQPQIALKRIDGSNNSNIYEIFQIITVTNFNESLSENPQKFQNFQNSQKIPQYRPLGLIKKSISHQITHEKKKPSHQKQCHDLFNECQIVQNLSHENIVSFQQYQRNPQECCIIMEKYDLSLANYLLQQKNYPNLEKTRKIFLQILQAVDYLHDSQIAHNDIKLANIFLNLNPLKAVLGDFGFAKKQPVGNAFLQKNQENQINQENQQGFQNEKNQNLSTNQNLQEQAKSWHNRNKLTMAPEMNLLVEQFKAENLNLAGQNLAQKPALSEFSSDLFSFGIILFWAIFRTYPFSISASPCDPIFKNMYQENQGQQKDNIKFWKQPQFAAALGHIKNLENQYEKNKFPQLMDLISRCLEPIPQNRITAKQALNHVWFQE
ncbi:Protein kinase-like domain [Pseudocohnilembus persalinus]|uniref:Protein kinase-like domain n=1 Tax=Pseudocohnilembus persalinus TaxID=266149 RepID=A0A0V0QDL2_PSEPJ|nr:Protein kinase-like domain [Pseudocohnilembus persalinus]|eukprot:KRX00292.1 Protein kinase-like domain [Pseudocohnilembus persalinus]